MQGFGVGLVPVVGLYLSLQEAELKRKCEPQALYKAAGARLAESVAMVPSSTPLLERELEKDVRSVCHRLTNNYYLLVGPRGCGKTSTAVAAGCERRDGTTLTPRPGVLLLKADNKGDAVHHILRALAPHDATKAAFDDMVKEANLDTLTPVFKAAIEAHKSQVVAKAKGDKSSEPAASDDDGWVPTVIIEVDRNLKPDDVADVCRVAKHLACEQKVAAVVLVLSDAGTTGIPPDDSRQARAHTSAVVLGWPVIASVLVLLPLITDVSSSLLSPQAVCVAFLHPVQSFFWLGDFTQEEADAFLDALEMQGGPRVTPEERLEVYSRVGTRAATLAKLVNIPTATERKGTPADWLCDKMAVGVETQVTNFLDPLLEPKRYSERVRLLQDLLDGKSTHRAHACIGRCGVAVKRALAFICTVFVDPRPLSSPPPHAHTAHLGRPLLRLV
jgi:hypothetical protein